MPKSQSRKHKRKTPVTSPAGPSNRPAPSSSNPHATRTTIRRFHILIKRKAQLQRAIQYQPHAASEKTELQDVERQIDELGGLAAYQRMSTIGQGKDRGGGSEKVLINWMRDLGPRTPQTITATSKHKGNDNHNHTRLSLLEVGALKPDNYASCQAWLDVTPIDLHSQHPSILEQDFLLMDLEQHRDRWDIISLSLVLNFVPNAKDRGRMLRLAYTMLRSAGLLFVTLPLPCILNSRYLTPEHFASLMSAVGFEQVQSRWKEGGKMAYWLFRRTSRAASTTYQDHLLYENKTVFRRGDRNNFVILL